jgi:hypothetical protein
LRHDRGDDGNGGIIRSPQRAIVLPDMLVLPEHCSVICKFARGRRDPPPRSRALSGETLTAWMRLPEFPRARPGSVLDDIGLELSVANRGGVTPLA